MLEKRATTIVNGKMFAEALYVPTQGAWALWNTSRIKVASIDKTKKTDLGGFDLKAAVEENPDNLFVKVFAIKANEVNDNGDCFNEEELKKSAHTFIGVPVFVNHQNDNIENARGKVVHAWYDDDSKGIYCINMVDRIAYPRLARGIEQNYVNGTSMGAQVTYSICSICHNKAHTADEFCFVGNTPILMADLSTKPISQIVVGDEVIDAFGKQTKVTHLFERNISEKILSLKSRAIEGEILCTKNHPFMVFSRGEYRFVCADHLTDNHILYTCKPEFCQDDSLFENYGFGHFNDEQKSKFARLLGYYGAEGCRIKRDGKVKAFEITFSKDETKYIDDVINICESLFNIKPQVYSNSYTKNTTRIRLWNEKIANVLVSLCPGIIHRERSKKYNKDVFSLSNKYIKELLSAFFDGDGFIDNKTKLSCSSACRSLISQIYYMLMMVGASPSMNCYINKGGPLNREKESLIYRVSLGNSQVRAASLEGDKSSRVATMDYEYTKLDNIWTEDGMFAKHSLYSVEDVDFEGKVYNFETESHSYVANNTCVHNCTHIKNGKNRKISGKYECKYHESPCKPEDDCPLDGKKKSDSKEIIHKESKVFEWNYGIKFIEDSFVVNPACHDCLVCDVINKDNLESILAQAEETKKMASSIIAKRSTNSLEKIAGQAELQALAEAMNLMDRVARSMMAQKQQIQLDYVSDLVENLAKVQSLHDELAEMGYSQLPSPSEQEIAFGTGLVGGVSSNQSQQISNPSQVNSSPQQLSQPLMNNLTPPSQSQSQNGTPSSTGLGDLGSVTRPTFTASTEIKKDFLKQAQNMITKLKSLNSRLQPSVLLIAQRRKEVAESENLAEFTEGNIKITLANVDNEGLVVGKWKDDKLVSWASIEEFGEEIKKLSASNNYAEAAQAIFNKIKNTQNELGANMSANTTKVASSETSQQEVITQKQLDNAGPLHPREEKAPTVITQAQLEGKGEIKAVNDTTSDSNQLRKDKSPDVITQAQLDSIDHEDLARWNDFPEVITQGQWDEMSRRVSSSLGSDYTDQITQAQLQSLQKSHKWLTPETITQDQLNNQKKVSPEGKTESARWAATAKDLVKSASSAISDAIANYNLTPEEVAKAVRHISASPYSAIKAGYLSLINASPKKIEARKEERKSANYFAKINKSAKVKVNPVDGLLAAMGDNIGCLTCEDFVEAVKFVGNDKKAFASAENAARIKMASASSEVSEVEVLDRNSLFREAFAEIERPEDGLYKICGTLSEDVKEDPKDKSKFMTALVSFAKNHIDVPFIISKVDLDKEAGVFEIECKAENVCSDAEKKAFASAMNNQFKTSSSAKSTRSSNRASLVKESQMMGGQMGGGMGGGGPTGGMGTMPGADMNGGGMPPAENLGGQPGDLGSEGEDMMGEDESDMQPQPPGTICPVCGSNDVDIMDGKGKCSSCSAEFSYKVTLDITKYPGLLDSGGEDKDSQMGNMDEDGKGGEGFALPEGEDTSSIPVAAMTRVNPDMIKKSSALAKASGRAWSLGSVSPYTGSNSVMKIDTNKFLCLDTGAPYEVHVAGVENNGKKAIFAEWRFQMKPGISSCETCRRKKTAFASALKSHGISEESFESMLLMGKGETILAMKNKGLFNNVKVASSEKSIVNSLKKTAGFGSKFPIETCREKIARKFGENAVALSGPCEGDNLADCVCKKLSTAGIYSNDIAIKVANVWSEEDQLVQCVEDFIGSKKFNMKQSCFICQQLKNKYAQFEETLADELGGEDSFSLGSPSSVDNSSTATDSATEENGNTQEFNDVDPFSSETNSLNSENGSSSLDNGGSEGSAGGTITIELPLEVLEKIDAAIDTAKGENPDSEPHHQVPLAGEAIIEVPQNAIESIDQVADTALDTAVDLTNDITKEIGDLDGDSTGGVEIDGVVNEGPGLNSKDPVEFSEDSTDEKNQEELEVVEDSSDSLNSSEQTEDLEESSENSFEEKEDSSDGLSNNTDSEGDLEDSEEDKEFKRMSQAESATRVFKKSKISSTGEINLDLSKVVDILSKQNKNLKVAKEVTLQNAQDDKDIGTISNGKTMGSESKFDAKAPEIFSGDATMGGEKDAGLTPPKDKPSFDSGGAEMGNEKEQGYTAEKQNSATGGEKGQGNVSASSKNRVTKLAERIIAAATKTASDKKLDNVKPVSEDEDTKPYAANKDNPKSGNPIKPLEEGDKDLGKIEAGDSSFMGHEKETLTNVPKEENSAPSIPAGGGKNPKYDNNEKNNPEKQTAHKGTVIAGGDAESLAVRKEAATRFAGRKLKAGIITIDNLASEIEKLARYEPSDLQQLENALFGTSKKGLDTVAKGSEKALVISEKSNQRKGSAEELKDSIQNLFTLQERNSLAQDNPDFGLKRKNYKS